MKEKVLITGAGSSLGYHLIQSALNMNLEVHAAVTKGDDGMRLAGLWIRYLVVDPGSPGSWLKILTSDTYSYIIHAGQICRARSYQHFQEVNVDNTLNLARAVEQSGKSIKKIVFISSLAAVGPLSNHSDLITEARESKPVSAYGKSKLRAEQGLACFSLPLVILRPATIYGPFERDHLNRLKLMAAGLETYIGKSPRLESFVHAEDLARVTIKSLLDSEVRGIFNISDGNYYSRYAFAAVVRSVMNIKTVKMYIPCGFARLMASVLQSVYALMNKVPILHREKVMEMLADSWACDITKAREELGFCPRYKLENGLDSTIKWYRLNKWLR